MKWLGRPGRLTPSYERTWFSRVEGREVEPVATPYRVAAVVLRVGGHPESGGEDSTSISRSRPSAVRTPPAVMRSIGSLISSTFGRLNVRR